jgi:predicted nicotinamide N-methyase
MALARHVLDHPETVRGRAILDLGSGSGLVAIAAMKAGARSAIAVDIDPFAAAAIVANAEANGVIVTIIDHDILDARPPAADTVLVGDLFYDAALAARVAAFLDACTGAGASVLVGDPHRTYLPLDRLSLIAEYPVPDVGDVEGTARHPGAVFKWKSPASA